MKLDIYIKIFFLAVNLKLTWSLLMWRWREKLIRWEAQQNQLWPSSLQFSNNVI